MPGELGQESELHKLIRYAMDFEVERMMRETDGLKGENRRMKKDLRRIRKNTNRRKARRRKRSRG